MLPPISHSPSYGRSDLFLVPAEHYSVSPPNSGALAFLAVMRIRQYDMDNSMGTSWNSNHSRAAKVPVWRILEQTVTKAHGEM